MKTGKWMKVITMLLIIAVFVTSMPTIPVLAYENADDGRNAYEETLGEKAGEYH